MCIDRTNEERYWKETEKERNYDAERFQFPQIASSKGFWIYRNTVRSHRTRSANVV